MRRSAPALVLDRRLQRQRHAEKAAVVAVAADDHQPHGCRARRLDRQRDGAAVEEVDDGGIAQQAAVEAPVSSSLSKAAMGGAMIGTVGMSRASNSAVRVSI